VRGGVPDRRSDSSEMDGHAAWTWHMRGDQSPVTGCTAVDRRTGRHTRPECMRTASRASGRVVCVAVVGSARARPWWTRRLSVSRQRHILLMAHGVHGRRRARDQRALTQYQYGCKNSYGNGWSGGGWCGGVAPRRAAGGFFPTVIISGYIFLLDVPHTGGPSACIMPTASAWREQTA
jgi:hypothetical protein